MSNTFTALKQPLLTLTSNPQSLRATEVAIFLFSEKKKKKKTFQRESVF